MKKILFVLVILTLVIFNCRGQGDQTTIFVPISSFGNTLPALLHKPDDYATTVTKYPLIIFCHGNGEGGPSDGSGLSNIYNSASAGGPAYFIAHGQWPSSISGYKPFVLSPQNGGWSVPATSLPYVINYMILNYRIDPSRIYITGLSAGGESTVGYASHFDPETGQPVVVTYKAAAIVPMSAATGNPGANFGKTTVADSTHVWGFGSVPADIHGENTLTYINQVNSAKPGFGIFRNYPGGHCCWGTFYNPAWKDSLSGISIYQWMLQYSNGNTVATLPPPPPPVISTTRKYIIPNVEGGVTMNASFIYNPGDTFVLKSSYAWTYFSLNGIKGTALKHIRIVIEGGITKMVNGINFTDCQYIDVDGYLNASTPNGLWISDPLIANGPAFGVNGKSSNISFQHFYLYNKFYGFLIKNEADCDSTVNYPNWIINGIDIHDGKIVLMNSQGFYVGSTDPNNIDRPIVCNSQVVYPIPTRLGNIHIWNVIVDSTGRPGIQISGAQYGYTEIDHNTITNTGMQLDPAQGNGIVFGGYSRGRIHHNTVKYTLTDGIKIFGSGLTTIDSNTVDKPGVLGSHVDTTVQAIFVTTRHTIPTDSLYIVIKDNKLGTSPARVKPFIYREIYMGDDYGTFGYNNQVSGNTRISGGPAVIEASNFDPNNASMKPIHYYGGTGIVIVPPPPPPPPTKTVLVRYLFIIYSDGTSDLIKQ